MANGMDKEDNCEERAIRELGKDILRWILEEENFVYDFESDGKGHRQQSKVKNRFSFRS
jgi:hypothetical protein